jgi:hypothetical protein
MGVGRRGASLRRSEGSPREMRGFGTRGPAQHRGDETRQKTEASAAQNIDEAITLVIAGRSRGTENGPLLKVKTR